MLGGFTLEYKGKELVIHHNNVSKTTQLFQLLLLHTQDGGISKAALIDALYGRSDVENKNGSLNNTIFRLRKQLTAAGLPESSYININGGMCTWDPDIETSVDVCDFKQTIESARHEKSQKTKMEIYAKAWKLYTGEFHPGYDGRGLGGSRKHRMSRYVFRLCRRTVPLPENRRKIRRTLPCCTQRSRNLSILRLADMGNRQPHRNVPLQRRPRCLQKNNQADVRRTRPVTICRNARAIQTYGRANVSGSRHDRRHQVPLREKESIEGAYYCTYPSFVDVYHVFGRMMERTGMSVFLMLCTLNFINIETDDENQKYYSELLRESIQKAVRKGDFYTRYNIQQYLVMLIGITQENCTLVSKRINKEFNKRLTRRKNVSIDYYVASLGEVCND